jgi:hypothetical protein
MIWIYKKWLFPKLVALDTKEIEKNPKWITNKSKDYYGFTDIDFILVESKIFDALPRLRITKDHRFQLLLSTDTLTKDVDDIIKVALSGKIYVKYGVFFPDKSIHWLSILCYMLDGGDIKQEATSWEETNMKK